MEMTPAQRRLLVKAAKDSQGDISLFNTNWRTLKALRDAGYVKDEKRVIEGPERDEVVTLIKTLVQEAKNEMNGNNWQKAGDILKTAGTLQSSLFQTTLRITPEGRKAVEEKTNEASK